MEGELWQRAKQIFLDAAELPQEKRKSFLNKACGDDDSLRAHVDALLESEQQADQFLHTQPETGETKNLEASSNTDHFGEGSGTRIGPYKLLQQIGEGGFGAVYMAEQTEPVVRKVALKIIKLGMDTKQTLARFEAERQALAMMDHPNIARVLDAGATDSGRPYFVMELVKGVSITQYCDTERLRTRDRLDLFIQVCHAVQHAHQKGIIHRDIKPSNVMITMHDGKPVPKVIDFGIAKATNARLTEKTLFTEYGQLIGTPAYMSPEQAEMSGLDIDTRSDIYSLGVLLYELLTGLTPFDAASLRDAGYEEMRRIIREEEPPKPSTRLSSAGFALSEFAAANQAKQSTDSGLASSDSSSIDDIARFRRTDPVSLSRQLRGDLDWIVMKCLNKDRNRRYETANGVALEIERHLNNEPVLVGAPSPGYRLVKFVRRHRLRVIVAGVIVIVLVAATTVSIGFALSEAEQRRVAQTAEREQSRAREEAETQTRIAEAVNEFLNQDLLAAVMPSSESGKGRDVLMRDVLDEAAKRIEKESRAGGRFEGMPLVEASIRATLGSTYAALGLYAAAEPHLQRARMLRHREFGEEHPDTLTSMRELSFLYREQGLYEKSEPLLKKTLVIVKRLYGEEHPDTLATINSLAMLYNDQGRYKEAERLYLKTLEIQKRVLGEEHEDTLGCIVNLGLLYINQGRYTEAEAIFLKTLPIMKRALGEEHHHTSACMHNLALVYMYQGRYNDAEPMFINILEITERIEGEEHHETLMAMTSLAMVYNGQARYVEAEALYLKTLEIQKRVLGLKHPETLLSMGNLAILYDNLRRYDEAEQLYLEMLEMQRKVLPEEHKDLLGTITNLGLLYVSMGRFDDAREMLETSLPIKRRVLGMHHPWTRYAMQGLARAYLELGRREDALPLFRELLDLQLAATDSPNADPNTLNAAAWTLLTQDFEELNDPDRALSLAQRACAMTNNVSPALLDTLALAQFMTGDTPAAIETEKKAMSLLPPDAPGRSEYEAALARFEAALMEQDTVKKTGGE